jgi:hypothetical protein
MLTFCMFVWLYGCMVSSHPVAGGICPSVVLARYIAQKYLNYISLSLSLSFSLSPPFLILLTAPTGTRSRIVSPDPQTFF